MDKRTWISVLWGMFRLLGLGKEEEPVKETGKEDLSGRRKTKRLSPRNQVQIGSISRKRD